MNYHDNLNEYSKMPRTAMKRSDHNEPIPRLTFWHEIWHYRERIFLYALFILLMTIISAYR